MAKNKSLSVGIVYKAIPIAQDTGGDPVTIYVRGLSPADISAIMGDGEAQSLAQLYVELTTGATSPEDVVAIGLKMIQDMPNLAAKIIAYGGDLPDEWEEVRKWAVGAQAECLQAIGILTFQSESVGKKLMEIAKQFAKGLPTAETLTESKTGSGD